MIKIRNRFDYRNKVLDKTASVLGDDKSIIYSSISEWAGNPDRPNTKPLKEFARYKFGKGGTNQEVVVIDKWYREVQQPELRKLFGDTVKAYRGIRGDVAEEYNKTGIYNPRDVEDWTLSKNQAIQFAKSTANLPIEHRTDKKLKGVVLEADIPIKNVVASFLTARLPMGERNIIVAGLNKISKSTDSYSFVQKVKVDGNRMPVVVLDASQHYSGLIKANTKSGRKSLHRAKMVRVSSVR